MSLGFPVFRKTAGLRAENEHEEHLRLPVSPRIPNDNVAKAECISLLEPQFLPWQNLLKAKFLLLRREEGALCFDFFMLASCRCDGGAPGSDQE